MNRSSRETKSVFQKNFNKCTPTYPIQLLKSTKKTVCSTNLKGDNLDVLLLNYSKNCFGYYVFAQ